MKKNAIFIIAVLIGILLLLGSAHSQDDMEFVDNSVFKKPRRVRAVFQHDQHNEKAQIDECYLCHHVYEDGKLLEDESSEDQRCADCHELQASEGKPALMKAYHLSCKVCHLQKKEGPITCGECHQK